MAVQDYVGFVVVTNNQDGNGWVIHDGPVIRKLAREKKKELDSTGEFMRVRVLPVGDGMREEVDK